MGKLLDEEMTKEERLDLEDSEAVCRRFLTWDLDDKQGLGEGGVKTKLAEVLGKNFFDPWLHGNQTSDRRYDMELYADY